MPLLQSSVICPLPSSHWTPSLSVTRATPASPLLQPGLEPTHFKPNSTWLHGLSKLLIVSLNSSVRGVGMAIPAYRDLLRIHTANVVSASWDDKRSLARHGARALSFPRDGATSG